MRYMNQRKLFFIAADVVIVFVANLLCFALNDLFKLNTAIDFNFPVFMLLNIFICPLSLTAAGEYTKPWKKFKKYDYLKTAIILLIANIIVFLINIVGKNNVKILQIFITYVFSTVGCIVFRFSVKRTSNMLVDQGRDQLRKRTLIVGAGQACEMILAEMRVADANNKSLTYKPICIVDDDVFKQKRSIKGIKIVGMTDDIPKICAENNIDTIMFAIPSCDEKNRTRILNICYKTECSVKVMPDLRKLVYESDNLINRFEDIKIEDLLGRSQVSFDNTEIAKFILGKVCMVTGGGGSIGSELVRQIAKYNPKRIVIVDIYENNAYNIQQELAREYGNTLDVATLISSVRDYDKMKVIVEKYMPDIIFHAAAHKHVPLMETVPEEAVKNNVAGTMNMAMVADTCGVKKFVLISTDKAVNPTNVMGATKRCCEMIVQYMAQKGSNTEFVAVRFGNVLGSNGSVIPLFRKQIESGCPVTVTHPEIIRYFMTIPEAVSLILQAATIAHGSEIFVLDMGEPVKILTLAENLIRIYGKIPYKEVKIEFTGLRPGEKLYEEILMSEEGLTSTQNKKIFIGKQIEIKEKEFMHDITKLCEFASVNDSTNTIAMLKKLVPSFNHMVLSSASEREKDNYTEWHKKENAAVNI